MTPWRKYVSRQPPSRLQMLLPDTRDYGATCPSKISENTAERYERSAMWFSIKRRGGSVLLHQRRNRPVLIRDWSTTMDGITATIWASRSMNNPVAGHAGMASVAAR
jgi:hypothetical protein